MATYVQEVEQAEDDAYETANGQGFNSTATRLEPQSHSNVTLRRHCGWFFDVVNIPPGSIINSALINFRSVNSNGMAGDLHAHDVDNAQDFADLADVTTRTGTVTSASTECILDFTGFQDFDITTVVQEIVDRAGWAQNNAICILLVARTTPNVGGRIYAADHSTIRGARLTIDFTPPAPGGGPNLIGGVSVFLAGAGVS